MVWAVTLELECASAVAIKREIRKNEALWRTVSLLVDHSPIVCMDDMVDVLAHTEMKSVGASLPAKATVMTHVLR